MSLNNYSLLISPESKGAFFQEYKESALIEASYCFPHISFKLNSTGSMSFLHFEAEETEIPMLTRLSFFQGVFKRADNHLIPLDTSPDFKLTDQFIFGSKFKGKTNERFTQMMLNTGLASLSSTDKVKILDPMCGKATTLLWSMRYGINSKGVELIPESLNDISQIVKKWSKVCSIQSKVSTGFIAKKNRSNHGKFLEFSAQSENFKVVIGNSSEASSLLRGEKFNLIVTDIPYGIQHYSSGGARSPIETLKQCLPEWSKCLSPKGAIVIGFNSNNPSRKNIEEIASEAGLTTIDFTIPHRMSESIVRDVIILKV